MSTTAWRSMTVAACALSVLVSVVASGQVAPRGAGDTRAIHEQLHRAAAEGDAVAVKHLLEQGAMSSYRDRDRSPYLHVAVQNTHFAVVDLLLEAGAYIDERDLVGRTPLHIAALYSTPKMYDRLVEAGADQSATFDFGRTVLSCAMTNSDPCAVRMFMKWAGLGTRLPTWLAGIEPLQSGWRSSSGWASESTAETSTVTARFTTQPTSAVETRLSFSSTLGRTLGRQIAAGTSRFTAPP